MSFVYTEQTDNQALLNPWTCSHADTVNTYGSLQPDTPSLIRHKLN